MTRRDRRSRTLKSGRILLDGGGVIDCVIRDTSQQGARIRIGTAAPLPQAFQLFLPASRMVVRAKLRWQRGLDAGVTFLEAPKPTDLH
jgi:hypothetical protein